MDDTTHSAAIKNKKPDNQIPLGMNSFSSKDQQQFGRDIRLAMSCIEGVDEPVNVKAIPDDETTLRQRLRTLTQEMNSSQADLLELLVRFDELEGWKSSNAKHCVAWMNSEVGIGMKLGWEYLRVGRELRLLPTTRALFRAGKLSWSKIRLLVRVADKDNEKTLCHAALDASVSDVARLCDDYKWKEDDKDDGENDRALKQWNARSLSWEQTSIGSTCIRLTLPPEMAQAFLNSVEHSLSMLNEEGMLNEDLQPTISQQRADAAVLMAETSLQAAGREIATADRYQVIVSVEADELTTPDPHKASISPIPAKRPTIKGAGAIARETTRRIACDCSVTTHAINNGEPTDIGRKSRVWPPAMARAIKNRDQHCQFPGCTQTRNLQIHHIVHWADGGSTSISNGVCVCSGCHHKLHEGGYRIEKVDDNEQRLNAQFEQQQRANDNSLFDFEKELRNDRESFDTIRKLLPTRYRFRVVDAAGRDIRNELFENNSTSTPDEPAESTRVACAESPPRVYGFTKIKNSRQLPLRTAELSAVYCVNSTVYTLLISPATSSTVF